MNKKTSLKDLKLSHTKEAIRRRLAKGTPHSYLKDFVYGAIDGIVTTFAVVAGVAGAKLSIIIVIILGFCNLIADGFSMAVSNFLGTKAEQELRSKAEREEEKHIELIPEGEKEEIRQIFAAKGFHGENLEKIVSVITSDSKLWVDTMIHEELGLAPQAGSPYKAALITFFAFISVGFLPLLPIIVAYFFSGFTRPFQWSSVITGAAFFIVGAFKGPIVGKKWYKSGLETLFIGGSAACLAYIVGVLLKGIV